MHNDNDPTTGDTETGAVPRLYRLLNGQHTRTSRGFTASLEACPENDRATSF